MQGNNVQSSQGVTLVGPASPRRQDLDDALALAPALVAADGGAAHCLEAGLGPMAVIGDFDSFDPASIPNLPETRLIRIDEQETTDFEKCLALIDAPFILATGFTDGRVDHTMAVWSVLARRIGPPTVVIGPHDVTFAAPETLELDVPAGTRVSLFPMAEVTGRSTGLQWPIDQLTLTPMGRIGTSNRATGPVRIEFDAPGCLVITQREALAAALKALTG